MFDHPETTLRAALFGFRQRAFQRQGGRRFWGRCTAFPETMLARTFPRASPQAMVLAQASAAVGSVDAH